MHSKIFFAIYSHLVLTNFKGYSLHPNDERDLWDDDTDVFINLRGERNYSGHRNLLAVRSADLTARLVKMLY